jgi:streptogramin lyase
MGGTGIRHFTHLARRAACALAVVAASLAGAASASAALTPGADCQALPARTCLGAPFAPGDQSAAVLANLGSPTSPEEDLTQALSDLAGAPDADAAAKARGRALAILEGSATPLAAGDEAFLDDKAYKGIALLGTQAKIQEVPAGTTTVDVREVRFGDHALLDTSMLRFADMSTQFTIRWHVTELGTSFGGVLSPAAVPASGDAENAVLQPLGLPGLMMGTHQANRFNPGGLDEETRLATQVFTVGPLTPSALVGGGILDPNIKAGHETFAQIAVGAADAADPDVPATVADIAAESPARQLHDDLDAVEPADPGFFDAAKAKGAQDGDLVGAMMSRDTLPKPAAASASADVSVQFANSEAYVSKRALRVAPGGAVTFSVTNLDGVDHDFAVRQLHDRAKVDPLGVLAWGHFTTDVLDRVTVPAGATVSVPVDTLAADAFSLWIGDPQGGDQAAMAISLDRGPRQQSLSLGLGPLLPLHQALDRSGQMWVSMANNDTVVRLTPTTDSLSNPDPQVFPLPGGITADPPPPGTAAVPVLGPGDVQVDGHGIVWVTLGVANAIARIDPALAHPNTTDGITIFTLTPCTQATCRRIAVPGAAGTALSRVPLQMRLWEDGNENTVMAFTEQMSDAIGLLRVSPTGKKLDEAHVGCNCLQPLGLALDPDGDIWFTEGSSNRLGRMTLDQTDPFAAAPSSILHYDIPNAVCEPVPGQVPNGDPACQTPTGPLPPLALPNPALTTLPHSVAVDREGRVWYTGEASERIGYLDPARANPNTADGFRDAPGPKNQFGRALAPADMGIGADDTVYFSDEYGDQIASATVDADGVIHATSAFTPTERNSLTDSPLVDPAGNLWFMEGGANLITRISGVAAGVPLPLRSALITANTASGRITGSGLSTEVRSIDVRLLRGAQVVAHADALSVSGQSFAATLPLRGGDTVEFVPHGAHPLHPFSFRVANLVAGVTANGSVGGSATLGSAPLADSVTIGVAGGTATAAVSADDGSFTWAGHLAAGVGGTVSWTAGTMSARFRTVTPFAGGAPAPAPAAAAPATPAAPGGGATGNGGGAVTPAPGGGGAKPAPACATGHWLTRSGGGRGARRAVPLLGMKKAEVERCLGGPSSRSSTRWTYRGKVGLDVRFAGGKVSGFTLLRAGLESTPDRAAVGASLGTFRRALGTLLRSGRGYRGAVAVGKSSAADVRLTVKGGRVTRIDVKLVSRRALGSAGARLLGGTR